MEFKNKVFLSSLILFSSLTNLEANIIDKLKGGSISRDYVKAKVLNDERKEIEKNADALFHLGKAYESEAKKSLDAAGIKKSAKDKDKDKTKSTESAADKAKKLQQELKEIRELSNGITSSLVASGIVALLDRII